MRRALTVALATALVGACTSTNEEPKTTCGEGTALEGPLCVRTAEERTCGANTAELDGGCLPLEPTVCGPGTTLVDGQCVLVKDGAFELRGLEPKVLADQRSHFSVHVFEWGADGAPAQDQVLLAVVPPGRGTLSSSALTLDGLGGGTTFTPCDPTATGCAGPFEITIVRASAPGLIAGSSGTRFVTVPSEPGPVEPCLVDGNAFFYEATTDDGTPRWSQLVTEGTFIGPVTPTTTFLRVTPKVVGPSDVRYWDIKIEAGGVGGLSVGYFVGAVNFPAMHQFGLNVGLEDIEILNLSSAFHVHRLSWNADRSVHELLMTYQEVNEGYGPNHGCLHLVN